MRAPGSSSSWWSTSLLVFFFLPQKTSVAMLPLMSVAPSMCAAGSQFGGQASPGSVPCSFSAGAVVALAGCVQLPWRHLNHVHACPCPAGARRERATAPAAAHTAWRRYTRRSRTVQTRRACPLDHASQKRTATLVREGASLVWGSSHLGLDPRFVST